jgi:hypothetical protein
LVHVSLSSTRGAGLVLCGRPVFDEPVNPYHAPPPHPPLSAASGQVVLPTSTPVVSGQANFLVDSPKAIAGGHPAETQLPSSIVIAEHGLN